MAFLLPRSEKLSFFRFLLFIFSIFYFCYLYFYHFSWFFLVILGLFDINSSKTAFRFHPLAIHWLLYLTSLRSHYFFLLLLTLSLSIPRFSIRFLLYIFLNRDVLLSIKRIVTTLKHSVSIELTIIQLGISFFCLCLPRTLTLACLVN